MAEIDVSCSMSVRLSATRAQAPHPVHGCMASELAVTVAGLRGGSKCCWRRRCLAAMRTGAQNGRGAACSGRSCAHAHARLSARLHRRHLATLRGYGCWTTAARIVWLQACPHYTMQKRAVGYAAIKAAAHCSVLLAWCQGWQNPALRASDLDLRVSWICVRTLRSYGPLSLL